MARGLCRKPEEKIVSALIERHHYLGYWQPVGEHLKYLVLTRGRPIACLPWCSAPFQLGPRDRFVGWSREAREKNLRLLAYNTRHLILPHVKVPHQARHILGRMAKLRLLDWERLTRFLHVPGVPLESSVVEQTLKKCILRRKNSLFHRTQKGARVCSPVVTHRIPQRRGVPSGPVAAWKGKDVALVGLAT